MKKSVLNLVVAVGLVALFSQSAGAFPTTVPHPTPDGGATAMLLLGSVAGLAALRKVLR